MVVMDIQEETDILEPEAAMASEEKGEILVSEAKMVCQVRLLARSEAKIECINAFFKFDP